jgi:predicted flap endonuclease-1-like 5' DNA nuclease
MDRQHIIDRIHRLRKIGRTQAQIAAKLNEEGVSTFSGFGRWQQPTISEIIRKYKKES